MLANGRLHGLFIQDKCFGIIIVCLPETPRPRQQTAELNKRFLEEEEEEEGRSFRCR